MTPDVDVVLPLLAAIEAEIPGIGACHAAPPLSISAADLPAFINLPGPATVSEPQDDDGASEFFEQRVYYCILLVAPAGSGVEGEAFEKCNSWFKRVRNKLASYQALKGAAALQMTYGGDAGARPDIVYNGNAYFGIRFTVTIQGRVRVPYATGE